jgi:hypothetical protein
MQVILQVILNVPEGSGKELTGDRYEELIDNILNSEVEAGNLPGVAFASVTFEDCV